MLDAIWPTGLHQHQRAALDLHSADKGGALATCSVGYHDLVAGLQLRQILSSAAWSLDVRMHRACAAGEYTR